MELHHVELLWGGCADAEQRQSARRACDQSAFVILDV